MKRNNMDRHDTEAALLASLGTGVASATEYESSVVRDATLASAPSLDGWGFPDGCLAELAPGGKEVTEEEVGHFISALAKTMTDLSSLSRGHGGGGSGGREANLLHLRQQMILSYLLDVTGLEEGRVWEAVTDATGYTRKAEILEERGRKEAAMTGLTEANSRRGRRSDNECVREKEVGGDGRLAPVSALESSTAPASSEHISPQQRLERIKCGYAGATLGQQVLQDRQQTVEMARRRRKRNQQKQSLAEANKGSIMATRRRMEAESGAEVAWKRNAEEVERRRKRREERRERWLQRSEREPSSLSRKRRFPITRQDENRIEGESKVIGSDSEDVEFEFDGRDIAVDARDGDLSNSSTKTTSGVRSRDGERSSVKKIVCPMCHELLPVRTGLDTDAVLAFHIDTCQRRGARIRRQSAVTSPVARNTSRRRFESEGCSKEDLYLNPDSASPPLSPTVNLSASEADINQSVSLPFRGASDDLEEVNYEDRVEAWQTEGVTKMKHMSERDQEQNNPGAVLYEGGLQIPAWINNRLFGYQRTGVGWLWELHRQSAGGIVGDEMGLGKTVQICSFLSSMAASRKLDSVLIVCPATILRHWMTELATWAPGMRRILIHKSGETDGRPRAISGILLRRLDKWLQLARADMVNEAIDDRDYQDFDENIFCGTGYTVITTYENIRKSADVWTKHTWSYVILDEGQKIRNPDADVTLACKRFRTPHRLLLSGTPIQNDLKELWSLFDFVFPGRLGTLPTFEAEFSDPIRRGGYTNASPMQVQLAYRYALVLRDLINPYLLRRQKKEVKEVAQMPGKTEQVLFCRLSPRQRAMYESYLKSDDVAKSIRGSHTTFKAITVLRKICNHPDLIATDNNSYEHFLRYGHDNEDDSSSNDEDDFDHSDDVVARSGKLEVLAKILPLWKKQGHRVLIFCQWTKMLNIIECFVKQRGWKFGRLDGKTNIASRQRLVDTFNADESYFGMLLTTRTGGVGLNLVGANRIILYDPDWNPQTDAQARERAWRFGQKKEVCVYRLITAGAIEERIYHRQIFKQAISSAVLVDPKQRRLFSQKDLRDLFTLKADGGSISSGGDGVTTTGDITRGRGVIDRKDVESNPSNHDSGKREDYQDTLAAAMRSRGLAGVFDHDFTLKPSSHARGLEREMQENATTAAQNARKALLSSAMHQQYFTPTCAGADHSITQRFGGSSSSSFAILTSNSKVASANPAFGGASSAGIASSDFQGQPRSSGALLSRLKERQKPVNDEASRIGGDIHTTGNAEVKRRIQAFIRRKGFSGGPSTDQILGEFSSIADQDAAVFRRMLLSVAERTERGIWRLK